MILKFKDLRKLAIEQEQQQQPQHQRRNGRRVVGRCNSCNHDNWLAKFEGRGHDNNCSCDCHIPVPEIVAER